MSNLSRWISAFGIIVAIPLSAFAQPATAPAVDPGWPDTSAPARYVFYPDDDNSKARITSVRLYFPEQRWEAMPIRVFTDDGTAIGCDLLWTAPGEPATLLFDSSSGAKRYKAYVGSNWPALHLPDAKSGVWLETREGNGKAINSLADMLQAWNQSSHVLGRALVNGIFEGGNRFGPQKNLFIHMRGWFEAAAAEHLQLAVISNDASFVQVDGKEVVEWPGLHDFRPGMGGQHQGAVDLPAGLHFLDYYNAYVSSDGEHPLMCCLAAKTDAAQPWEMLTPDNKFLRPATHAHVLMYELKTSSPTASSQGTVPTLAMEWLNREQSVINSDLPVGFISMQLTCIAVYKGTLNWTFDDGTTAQGQIVTHVFLRPGMRTVRLTVNDGAKQLAALSQTISVHPNWGYLTYAPPQLQPPQEADIMSRDPATLSASDLVSCFAIFGNYGKANDLAKLLPAMSSKMKEVNDADLPYVKDAALFLAREAWADYAGESQLLQALIERATAATPSPQMTTLASECRLALARLVLKTSDHLDETRSLLDAIAVPSLSNDEPRMLNLLRADFALAGGDVAGAKKQYEALTSAPTGPDERSSIRRTAKIGQARAFLDRKDFAAAEDALNEVAWKSPIDKLAPDWALARLRLYQEEGLPVVAYLWAKRLLPAITESGRSELLFRLTELAFAQGDNDLAHKTLSELLKKHPYSDEAAQAKEKWPGQQ